MKLSEIIGVIEKWAPKKHAEDFDNVGLLVGDSDSEISKGLITLDTTLEIIDEAISKDCNLIITFHPLIFNPIKKINSDDRINKIIIRAIKNNINIYCLHTNLDNNPMGVNYNILQILGMEKVDFIIPKITEDGSRIGMGMYGELKNGMNFEEFKILIKRNMKIDHFKFTKPCKKLIKKVGVLGGSGSFAIEHAIDLGLDCLITADLKYHDYFKADNKIILVDIGHYESEKYTKDLIFKHLNEKIPKFAIAIAETNTNPVNYN